MVLVLVREYARESDEVCSGERDDRYGHLVGFRQWANAGGDDNQFESVGEW